MKQIINGKMYNTETAKELTSWSNDVSYSDFSHCREVLYRKKTGEYFLYGEGGAMSKYSEYHGNCSSGGSKIIPLTENKAKAWAEKHIDSDKYIEIFGDVEE